MEKGVKMPPRALEPENVIDEQVLGFLEINFVKFPPKVKIAINDMCM